MTKNNVNRPMEGGDIKQWGEKWRRRPIHGSCEGLASDNAIASGLRAVNPMRKKKNFSNSIPKKREIGGHLIGQRACYSGFLGRGAVYGIQGRREV